ncbi:hypothetical protein DRP05_15075 [Archaeoglobales archaeon]|nr:MAG: hypothetical protein DRP05_15075 [Archaeoglobales archaeon]
MFFLKIDNRLIDPERIYEVARSLDGCIEIRYENRVAAYLPSWMEERIRKDAELKDMFKKADLFAEEIAKLVITAQTGEPEDFYKTLEEMKILDIKMFEEEFLKALETKRAMEAKGC